MIAVREDEIAAEAMGINTTRFKIMAFTIGVFFAGVGGGLVLQGDAKEMPHNEQVRKAYLGG